MQTSLISIRLTKCRLRSIGLAHKPTDESPAGPRAPTPSDLSTCIYVFFAVFSPKSLSGSYRGEHEFQLGHPTSYAFAMSGALVDPVACISVSYSMPVLIRPFCSRYCPPFLHPPTEEQCDSSTEEQKYRNTAKHGYRISASQFYRTPVRQRSSFTVEQHNSFAVCQICRNTVEQIDSTTEEQQNSKAERQLYRTTALQIILKL